MNLDNIAGNGLHVGAVCGESEQSSIGKVKLFRENKVPARQNPHIALTCCYQQYSNFTEIPISLIINFFCSYRNSDIWD
jgi:hypothetical protein